MADELKRCPFCGCKVEINAVGRDWWRLSADIEHEEDCIFEDQWEIDVPKSDGAKEWLIEAWNTRQEECDRMRDVVKQGERICDDQLFSNTGESDASRLSEIGSLCVQALEVGKRG
jgi:hypothetical protein